MAGQILVPLDGSPLAERALPYAGTLARALGAGLLLVRVVAAQSGPAGRRRHAPWDVGEAEAYLSGLGRQLALRGVAAEGAVLRGEPVEWIARVAARRSAGLIVMASHGLDSWAFGSVARAVIDRAPAPVLVIPARCVVGGAETVVAGSRLLVPLDGTTFGEAALPAARRLATSLGGEITLLRAVPPSTCGPPRGGVELARVRAYLDQLAAHVATGTPVSRVVRIGRPAAAILAAAGESGAALIVMATHGAGPHSGPARTRAGSITGAVFCHSPIPLLLVRAAAGGPALAPRGAIDMAPAR